MEILKKIIEFVMDVLETVTFVGSLFIVVYLFVMQPHQIRGPSMEPTFHNAEYILTYKLAYKLGEPHRGDVVVFKSPEANDKDYIKRIIGIPGDSIKIEDSEVYVNNQRIQEDYISAKTNLPEGWAFENGVEQIVPTGHVFVMGDNRPRSQDSRYFGFIPEQTIIGRVFFRYFPADKVGTIKNPMTSLSPMRLVFSTDRL